jgi:aminoglycoside phosphotransferase (APT) family kinase protein
MTIEVLHDDELWIDLELAEDLVATQRARWRALPLQLAPEQGTDNVLFRLGDDLAVRLPRRTASESDVTAKAVAVDTIARYLPVPLPRLTTVGSPTSYYPSYWSVMTWLPGAAPGRTDVTEQLALDLAAFVGALHATDSSWVAEADRRPGAPYWHYRGGPFADRADDTRAALVACDGLLDVDVVSRAWDEVADVASESGATCWIHTDLQPGNVLVANGRLSGVIDLEGLAVGDPAIDMIVAWNLLDAQGRATFRAALDVDDDTWARGRAWALSIGLVALPYYASTSSPLVAISRYQIEQVVADVTG